VLGVSLHPSRYPKLAGALAGAVERIDRKTGLDSAPALAESLVEQGVPDTAFQVLVYLGCPALDALETVMEACDSAGADRDLAFDLIAGGLWR
jgi:hypothetical protein